MAGPEGRCLDERDLGIEVRAGVHTGECELVEGKCAGLTVSIGARVAAKAAPQVLVSRTVKVGQDEDTTTLLIAWMVAGEE